MIDPIENLLQMLKNIMKKYHNRYQSSQSHLSQCPQTNPVQLSSTSIAETGMISPKKSSASSSPSSCGYM